MAAFRQTWDDYSLGQKWVLGCLLGLGVVGAVVGAVFDLMHHWPQWSFIPNVATAVTGFCTGVPITLVVLNWLETQREERKLQALSDGAWSDFSLKVKEFCSEERIRVLQNVCPRIDERWCEIYATAVGYVNEGDVDKIWPHCEGWAAELEDLLNEVSACIPDHEGLIVQFAGIQSAWTLLDAHVRIRRIEMRVANPWLGGRFDPHIRQKVVPQENAIAEFVSRNRPISRPEGNSFSPAWDLTVRDLPNFVRVYASAKRAFVNSMAGPVSSIPSRDYANAAREAATFMQILNGAVRYAETYAEWPKPPRTEP